MLFRQTRMCSEEELADKQALLNAKYDKFVERYGYITGKSNKMAFRDDSDYPLLCSLEEVNEEGEVKKADMFYKQTIKAKPVIERVETAVEALNRVAKAAALENPAFGINVEALEKVQPERIEASDIDVRIGTTWIDPKDYEQFIYELLNTPRRARAVRSEWYNSGTP